MEELLATSVLILLHDIYEALNIMYLIVVLKPSVKLCCLLLHLNFPHIPHILHLKGFVNTAHYNIFVIYSYYKDIWQDRSDQSKIRKIVLNCNFDLIGYFFFRSIWSDLELNRAKIFDCVNNALSEAINEKISTKHKPSKEKTTYFEEKIFFIRRSIWVNSIPMIG